MSGQRHLFHLIAFISTIAIAWVVFRAVGPEPEPPPPEAAATAPSAPAVAAVPAVPAVPADVPGHLRFGDPATRAWMRQGWSVDESRGTETYVWSDGPASFLNLPLLQDAEVHLRIDAKPYGSGHPTQKVTVVLNGQAVEEVPLQPGRHPYAVALLRTSVRPGLNELEFRYAYTRRPQDVEPGSQDTRQLAVSWYAIDLLRVASHIRFGEPGVREHMGAGWSKDERLGDVTYVWSDGPRSQLDLALPAGDDVRMALLCQPYIYPGHPTQTITIVLNGTRVQTVVLGEGLQSYSAILPRRAIHAGANTLEFVYGYAERPEVVEVPSVDTRQLGVAWHSIDLTPLKK